MSLHCKKKNFLNKQITRFSNFRRRISVADVGVFDVRCRPWWVESRNLSWCLPAFLSWLYCERSEMRIWSWREDYCNHEATYLNIISDMDSMLICYLLDFRLPFFSEKHIMNSKEWICKCVNPTMLKSSAFLNKIYWSQCFVTFNDGLTFLTVTSYHSVFLTNIMYPQLQSDLSKKARKGDYFCSSWRRL